MGLESKLDESNSNTYSRRNFLRLVTRMGAVAGIAHYVYSAWEADVDEADRRLEKAESLPIESLVGEYYKEILRKAYQLLDNSYLEHADTALYGSSLVGFGAGIVPTWKIIRKKYDKAVSRRIFLTSGLASIINRVVDKYSTYRVALLTEDSRFREYGVNKAIIEGSPHLSMHPNPEEIFKPKKLVVDLSGTITGTVIVPFGFALGASAPFIHLRHAYLADMIELSYKIGDKVKDKIRQGYDSSQIRDYIKGLSLNDLLTHKT